MKVRPFASDDEAAVATVLDAAFSPSRVESAIADLLHARRKIVHAAVGEIDGAVVGYAATSAVTLTPDAGRRCLGLGPVAVHPACQGRGLGTLLVSAVLQAGREAGWDAAVVLGDPAYYGRFGFRESALGNAYGAGAAFQDLEWTEGCLVGMRADVRYAPEFDEAGS